MASCIKLNHRGRHSATCGCPVASCFMCWTMRHPSRQGTVLILTTEHPQGSLSLQAGARVQGRRWQVGGDMVSSQAAAQKPVLPIWQKQSTPICAVICLSCVSLCRLANDFHTRVILGLGLQYVKGNAAWAPGHIRRFWAPDSWFSPGRGHGAVPPSTLP